VFGLLADVGFMENYVPRPRTGYRWRSFERVRQMGLISCGRNPGQEYSWLPFSWDSFPRQRILLRAWVYLSPICLFPTGRRCLRWRAPVRRLGMDVVLPVRVSSGYARDSRSGGVCPAMWIDVYKSASAAGSLIPMPGHTRLLSRSRVLTIPSCSVLL
jgi:hypothetical protein